jgi:FkbM family methyltransferase
LFADASRVEEPPGPIQAGCVTHDVFRTDSGDPDAPQRGRTLQDELTYARTAVARLEQSNEELTRQATAVGAELAAARTALEQVRTTGKQLEEQLRAVGAELAGARDGIAQRDAQNAALTQQLVAVGDELGAARASFHQLAEQNAALTNQLHGVGSELAETRAVLAARTKAYDALVSSGATPGRADGSADARAAAAYKARSALILLPHVLDLLPRDEALVVVDVGAREADRDARWQPFPRHRLRFYGFEPEAGEADRLNQMRDEHRFPTEFFAAGLWSSTGTLTFHHNNIPGGSSFLRQQRAVTDRWKFENPTQVSLAREIFREAGTEEIEVVTLADWAAQQNVRDVDFMKLNVQGGELEVLRGAGPLLDGVLGILIEVAFVESYVGRPLFDDIDRFLRGAGFTFFDVLAHHYVGRADSPVAAQHLSVVNPTLGQLTSAWGQLIEGHALYFRDPVGAASGNRLPAPRVLKLAALAEAYGQVEFAFELLEWLRRRDDVAGTRESTQLQKAIDTAAAAYDRHLRPDVPRR